MPLEITLSSSDISDVDLLPGYSLVELEYADDIHLFGENADRSSLLTNLNSNQSKI